MKTKSPTVTIILIILTMITGCKSEKSEYEKMVEYGQKYTAAWNSTQPGKMASFYAENGTLIVNNGQPAVGRKQLAETAKSYMEAFPDMELIMDSLTVEEETYRYYWTFIGSNLILPMQALIMTVEKLIQN